MAQAVLFPELAAGLGTTSPPLRRRRRRRETVAFHEAGHAVTMILVGVPFRWVTTVPEPDLFGTIEGRVERGDRVLADSGEGIAWEILISLAGVIAEFRQTGRHHWAGAGLDLCSAVDLAYQLDPTAMGMLARVEDAYLACEGLFRGDESAWRAVTAMADSLVKRGGLFYASAIRITRDAGVIPPQSPPPVPLAPSPARKLPSQLAA